MITKLLLLLVFICQISFAQVSNANLIAYYSFDNTLVNAGPGGSAYNLAFFGSGTNPAYLATGGVTGGSINNPGCFEFNTTITLQNSEFFNLLASSNPNQSLSVSYWVYNNQAQNSGSIRTHFEAFGSMFARGGLGWGVSTQNGNFNTTTANLAFTSGVWDHIVLVFDANDQRLRMFVNGNAASQVITTANTFSKYNSKFVIGGGTDANGDNSLTKALSGRIDEMYVFNRALLPTEVTALYNKQVPAPNCPTTNYTATLQSQIDVLAGCTTFNGNLTINAPTATYLDALSSLTTVNGNFTIANGTSFTTLNGLSNLTTVTGNFIIGGVPVANLNQFTNLTTVGGIVLNGNNSLTDIQALSNISGSLTNNITIINNQILTNLNGLQNITQVASLNITNNAALQNISGLSGLTTLTNSFSNTLNIQTNPSLTSLNGLNNLVNLPNNGGVKILTNNTLTDISALASISNLAYLEITNNSNLSTCAIAPVCNLLTVNNANAFISDNGTNCSSKAVVQSFCPTCPTGDVTFTTQAEVDAFVTQYPNCTQISGNLSINGFNIPNLSGLSNLTTVTGNLLLNITINTAINTSGLQNITTVGGKLTVYKIGNASTNLDFLSSLTSVGSIEIANEVVTNIQGLSNITGALTGGIFINGCSNLTSLNGLQNITALGGQLNIVSNPLLNDLTGLQGLTSVNNEVVGGTYSLWIFNNTNLTSLNGLQNVTMLTSTAGNNPNTTSGFSIHTNPNLTNINALANITNILDIIQISGNTQLSTCAITSVCNKLANTTTGVTISGNATGCESIPVVQTACAALSTSDFELESNLKIYPNPFNSQITFDLGNYYEKTTIVIYDVTGKELYQNTFTGNQTTINHLGNLPAGIYLATITTENRTSITKKIVK